MSLDSMEPHFQKKGKISRTKSSWLEVRCYGEVDRRDEKSYPYNEKDACE